MQYDSLIKSAIDNISRTGGNKVDATIIVGHFGMIGDWIQPILTRVETGQASIKDVATITDKFKKFQ